MRIEENYFCSKLYKSDSVAAAAVPDHDVDVSDYLWWTLSFHI